MSIDASKPLPDATLDRSLYMRLLNLFPQKFQPYIRLARFDRPIGFWLLFLPCGWSLTLASGKAQDAYPSLWLMFLLALGALVSRAAGCVYNDILDRDLDAQVTRTMSRPLPAGEIKLNHAILFMVALALMGLIVLVQFNKISIILGVCSLLPVAAYPLMKRIIPIPQLVLGIAFAWGALMGWAVLMNDVSLAPIFLYVGTLFWIVGYDTIYALQDIEDDAMIGIHSSVLYFGEHTPFAVTCCYALSAFLITAAIFTVGATPFGYLGSALFAWHLLKQVRKISPKEDEDFIEPEVALSVFRSNKTAGLLLLGALILDTAFKSYV